MNARGLCALVALGCGLSSTTAWAFCRTHTCDLGDPAQNCQFDENDCLITGLPLFWPTACVSYGVQERGSPLRGISYEAANQVVIDGFLQWIEAECPDGGQPSIQIADFGPIQCDQPEYNQKAPNANVVMFRDDEWPYEEEGMATGDTLALTTVTFNVETGEIYDADIEVNSFQADSLAIDEVGPHDIDLRSVITHELGHFLGLSHTRVAGATMRPSLAPGQTSLATIEADDIAGICAIYPPDRPTTTTDCTPRHGFSRECATDTGCCTIAPGSRRSEHSEAGLVIAALGAALLGLRRRSLGRRSPWRSSET